MRALDAEEVVRIWEAGHRQGPGERALIILAAAAPAESDDQRRHLSLGRRNARLLAVRRRLFGGELSSFAECPECGAPLEFTVPAEAIEAARPPATALDCIVEAEGYAVRFRPL